MASDFLKLAAQIAVGNRPDGGPYGLSVLEDVASKQWHEFKFKIVVVTFDPKSTQSEMVLQGDWEQAIKDAIL